MHLNLPITHTNLLHESLVIQDSGTSTPRRHSSSGAGYQYSETHIVTRFPLVKVQIEACIAEIRNYSKLEVDLGNNKLSLRQTAHRTPWNASGML